MESKAVESSKILSSVENEITRAKTAANNGDLNEESHKEGDSNLLQVPILNAVSHSILRVAFVNESSLKMCVVLGVVLMIFINYVKPNGNFSKVV